MRNPSFMRLIYVLIKSILISAFSMLAVVAVAQPDMGEPMKLRNASFEDVPRQSHAPKGWYDCSFSSESPVDIHPGTALANGQAKAFFEVDQPPFDGNTYLGMVVRDNETYEAVSQRIPGGPLKAGKCYTFSIYLMQEKAYKSPSRMLASNDSVVNYNTPVKLRIFGGRSYCNRGEVIAESAPVKNNEWLQYNFRFEPKEDHAFIVLEAYYKTPVLFPYNGNILVDKAGDIVPILCEGEEPPAEEPVDELIAEVPVAEPTPEVPVATPPIVTKPEQTTAQRRESKLQGYSRSDLKAGSVVRVEKLFFKADSSAVNPASKPVLQEIYSFLDANPDVVIEVGGHTNGIPPDAFCDKLSTERAESVVSFLVAQGIDNRRLFAKGYGKRKPVATNKTPTGRKRNQRVEIKVLSIGG